MIEQEQPKINIPQEPGYLSDLTWLHEQAAYCENEQQLAFHIVNNTIKIAPYDQAIIWKKTPIGIRIEAVSGVSVINHSSLYITFLEHNLIPKILADYPEISEFNTSNYSELLKSYGRYVHPWCLSIPFDTYDNKSSGNHMTNEKARTGLILLSKNSWDEEVIDKLKNIVKYYKYLWDLFLRQSTFKLSKFKTLRKYKHIIIPAIFIILFFPLKESVLVPSEIAPKDPYVIASSMEGIIREIYVRPNEIVKQNQKLFKIDTISLDNKLDQSKKNLDVVKEKYRKAYQHSYNDPNAKGELKVLQTEIKIAESEVEYNASLLDRAVIRAEFSGTVIFSDPKYWLGKPIQVGERVMLLADDAKKQLDLFVPIDDLIATPADADVIFYPNPRPLDTVRASIKFISKKAEVQPNQNLAYYSVAEFDKKSSVNYQFGIKGTAKVYGYRVVLIYYIFRRPFSWLRRTVGI